MISHPTQKPELAIFSFSDTQSWRDWLALHHQITTEGIWLRIYKKGTPTQSVTYAEALDEALCFGWIDGQKKGYDTESWLQKFTPRRKKSLWSQVNIGHIARLSALGKMAPAGDAEVAKAKEDGRWEAAYASSRHAELPEDFAAQLLQNPVAYATYQALNKSQKYSIIFRLSTAKKAETKAKHAHRFLEELAQGRSPT